MSPASYRAAPPRVGSLTLAQPGGRLQNGPRLRSSPHPPALGDGVAGADGAADPDGVGLAPDAAACWAAWNFAMAASRACSASPYFAKSPDFWAVRTLSIAWSTAAAAWASSVFSWAGGVPLLLPLLLLPLLLLFPLWPWLGFCLPCWTSASRPCLRLSASTTYVPPSPYDIRTFCSNGAAVSWLPVFT